MARVVVDTNVFVSGLLTPGVSRSLLLKALSGTFTLVLSPPLLKEIEGTLAEFSAVGKIPEAEIRRVLSDIRKRAKMVKPSEALNVCRDPADDRILEAALASRAHCIVSGDKDLLVLHAFRGIPIISPSVFLTLLGAVEAEN